MRVKKSLIIDQSSSCCGFAVLDGDDLVGHGNLTSKFDSSTRRLMEFWQDLRSLAFDYMIDEVVIERIAYEGFSNKPAKAQQGQQLQFGGGAAGQKKARFYGEDTIEPLAGAAQICKFVAAEYGAKLYRVRPQVWKSKCDVKGRDSDAQKRSAKIRACQIWGLQPHEIASFDHSDALCIASYWKVFRDLYRCGQIK